MHPLLLYAAIREDQSERRRRLRLERSVSERSVVLDRAREHGRDRRSIRTRLERLGAILAGRRARPA